MFATCLRRLAMFFIAPILTIAGFTTIAGVTHASAQDGTNITATDDYFVAAFGDPMDFSNTEDLVTNTSEAMFSGGSNKSIADGQLHFDTNGITSFDPVWAGFPTGIAHGREGGRVPIDTARYKRLVIRMNAPEGVPAGLRWFSCLEQNDACQGGMGFTTKSGWNTYDLLIDSNAGLPVPWSGQMLGLRVVLNASAHFDVDWIRLVAADATNVDQIIGGATQTADLMPSGKLDYAKSAGNAWDMNALTDFAQQVHLSGSVSDGVYAACNQPATSKEGDPGLVLNLPSGSIDANRFKTLTFEYSYDGPFSAKTVPNGGMVARIFWTDSSGRHPTQGIHLYPNVHIVSVRLDDPAVALRGVEAGKGVATGKPWGGTVTQFRLDPNQDPGRRCFTVGRVWLTADESADASVPAVVPTTATTNAPAKAAAKSAAKATKRTLRK